MNVAVGGTNGWFPDRVGDKPWLDGSQSESLCPAMVPYLPISSLDAMADFWKNKNQWLPTWPTTVEDRALVVYVLCSFAAMTWMTNVRCR